ncbi:ER membrane protein complex subunit 1 [Cylas formicarius]|uniref:ER membrane protein complex subunit 1 n=1 Tax=Cylas formicarius TaxID=197179 RepID=UPI002958D133|nr:ER membrane protein complex subunit 1 [Cylas formicarius]
MANFRSIYKVQVFLTILIHLTVALYEDQVGKFDWKRSFVGKVKYVSFEAKKIIVATEENVLASLNLKNGNIQWRQLLEDPKECQIELLHVTRDVITVSGTKNAWLVRYWDLNTGTLLNEWSINVDKIVSSSFAMVNDSLLHIVPVTSSYLEVTKYELRGIEPGTIGSFKKIAAPWIAENTECVTASSFYVCLWGNQIYYVNLLAKDARFTSNSINDLLGNNVRHPVLIEYTDEQPSVLLSSNNVAKLLIITDETLELKPFDLMPNAVSISNDENVIYQLEANDNKYKLIRVKSKNRETGSDQFSVDLEYPLGLGAPIILGGQKKGSFADLLLSTTDNALLLVQLPEGKISWTREEALSNIVATEFFELPVSELDASIEHEFDSASDILTMFWHRIATQFNQFYNLLFGNKLLTNNNLVRDEFGLHKIIVVATRVGKLFALDTLTGSIAWSYRLPNIIPFIDFDKDKMVLFVQRTAQHAPLPAQCTLLARDSITGNGVYFEFDPITGYSSQNIQHLNYPIAQALLLPHADRNLIKPLVIVSDKNEVHLYPNKSMDFVKDFISTTFLYTTDSRLSILQGYSIKYSKEDHLKLIPTWNLDLAPSTLVALSAKPANERVHSQGKVLYDRSVYYKYVNPNLLAVATVSDDLVHRSVLTVYLIDGVTGLVLYSTSHKKAKGPVYLVHSENWLVYSFFNERFRRTELAAIELYEGHLQSNSSIFSSFAISQLPDVQSQSYILPAQPVNMAVTLTERGITNKFLLVALSTGAVVEIPWLLVQPRFGDMPCGPEESCIPYMPQIPLPSEATLNYNQSLARIRGIEVAPARLESTSHILVHGLDMFYTRVAPSKTFDVLKDDFDHRLIVLVLSGLIVASLITKHLASRKALKQAWK